jgi:hypothetical protein
LYFALCQFPIYLSPQLLKPIAKKLGEQQSKKTDGVVEVAGQGWTVVNLLLLGKERERRSKKPDLWGSGLFLRPAAIPCLHRSAKPPKWAPSLP